MADIVYSLLYRAADCPDDRFGEMAQMADLWARHLRGPGAHRGPIFLLTNVADLPVRDAEPIPIEDTPRAGRAILPLKVLSAYRHLRPEPDDRIMQLDIDSLARHPLQPLFEDVRPGEMRSAPSGLSLMHWQQVGYLLGRWQRRWYGRIRGWRRRIGVSSSLTACTGADWERFLARWASLIERFERAALPEPRPGDQAYLNYLYAFGQVPVRCYGPGEVHHLRLDDPAPREQIDAARVLHFPLPDKLTRMREWSLTGQ